MLSHGGRVLVVRWGHILLAGATVGLVLLMWQLAAVWGLIDRGTLASPSEVSAALWRLWGDPAFWRSLRNTMSLTAVGYIMAVGVGGFLGALLGTSRLLNDVCSPYILAYRSLPTSLMAPLFIAWFGFGSASRLATSVALGFFPMVINTATGLRAVRVAELELLRSLGASRWQTVAKVRLRRALPSVFAGLKYSLLLSFSGALLGEILIGGTTEGLGVLLREYVSLIQAASVFAVVVVAIAVLVCVIIVFGFVERKVVFWRDAQGGEK